MKFGILDFASVSKHKDWVAKPTAKAIEEHGLKGLSVARINPNFSDTATFCEEYEISLAAAANCVVVEAKRGDKVWYAACVILSTTRADVNGAVRRQLGARKISFAPLDKATDMTGMEFGGITPIGLPPDWEILVDSRVVQKDRLIIGSGIRESKLLVPGVLLGKLPGAVVLNIAKTD